MDFINKQNTVGILFKLFKQRFEAFFKITAIFCARQQGANIQRVDGAIGHDFRHVALNDPPGQALGDRGLTHAGLPHQQRVIFTAAAQHLNRALQLFVAADQRIDPADASKLIKIGGEVFHTILPACLLFIAGLASAVIGRLARLVFACTVRDEVDDVKTAHFMFTQQIGRL